jgi:transcriptional regulator with XRE-family HTH domain
MTFSILTAPDLGKRLRAERRALGKTQQDLAAAMGCRRQTVADLEAGRNVSLYTLIAALAALGKGLSVVNARPDIDQIQSLLEPSDED